MPGKCRLLLLLLWSVCSSLFYIKQSLSIYQTTKKLPLCLLIWYRIHVLSHIAYIYLFCQILPILFGRSSKYWHSAEFLNILCPFKRLRVIKLLGEENLWSDCFCHIPKITFLCKNNQNVIIYFEYKSFMTIDKFFYKKRIE